MKRSVFLTVLLGGMIGSLVMQASTVYAGGSGFTWSKYKDGNGKEQTYPAFVPVVGQPTDRTIDAVGTLILSGDVGLDQVVFRAWDVDPNTGGVIENSATDYTATATNRFYDVTNNTTTFTLNSDAEDVFGVKETFTLNSQYQVAFVITWKPPPGVLQVTQIFGTKIVTAGP